MLVLLVEACFFYELNVNGKTFMRTVPYSSLVIIHSHDVKRQQKMFLELSANEQR